MREAHGPQWQAHSLRSNLGSTLLSRMMLDRLLDRPVLSFVTSPSWGSAGLRSHPLGFHFGRLHSFLLFILFKESSQKSSPVII